MPGNKQSNIGDVKGETVDLGLEALLNGVIVPDTAIEPAQEVQQEISSPQKEVEEPVPAGVSKPIVEEPELERKVQNAIVEASKSRRLNKLVFLSALVAVIVGIYFLSTSLLATEPQVATLSIDMPEAKVALMLPELKPVSSVTHLGALFYDVQKNFEITVAPSVQAVATQSPKEVVKKSSRELIDTTGPVEPRSVRDRLSGRVQDSEPRELPVRSPSNETPIDAGWYRVTGAGSIVSEPGQVGRVMGRVARGDEVFVEARFGNWVRLKSKSGRTGYVRLDIVDSMPIERVGR